MQSDQFVIVEWSPAWQTGGSMLLYLCNDLDRQGKSRAQRETRCMWDVFVSDFMKYSRKFFLKQRHDYLGTAGQRYNRYRRSMYSDAFIRRFKKCKHRSAVFSSRHSMNKTSCCGPRPIKAICIWRSCGNFLSSRQWWWLCVFWLRTSDTRKQGRMPVCCDLELCLLRRADANLSHVRVYQW